MAVEVFANAPIEEAIITVRVPRLDDLSTSATYFHEAIADRLPGLEEIRSQAIPHFSPARSTGVPPRKGEPSGYRFSSADGLQAAAITRDGISFHRLRPYVQWEHFEAGFWPVWRAFVRHFGPVRVDEVRLRYLNRIPIPRTSFDLREYFNTYPTMPETIDTGLVGYLTRLWMVEPAIPATATLTLRSEPDEADSSVFPVVFDIDVATVEALAPDGPVLPERVAQLRAYKDRLFFDSITEVTRELFR